MGNELIGQRVADFTLPDQDGTQRSLSELAADQPVVLFFYPAAMTRGCTAEACHFRDLGQEFADAGAVRVGISRDTVAKQAEFAQAYGLDYPLLCDTDGAVTQALGVKRRFGLGPLTTRRLTFVIDTDLTVIDVNHSELSMTAHADQALRVLRQRNDRQDSAGEA